MPGAPIALLEDDVNDAFFVKHALEKARIVNPILHFDTATKAQSHFENARLSGVPALFVMDVHLAGGETGIGFLRWLRAQAPPLSTTPAMMLSGSSDPADRMDAQALGSIYFLSKPANEEKVVIAIQSLGFLVTSLTGYETERIIERKK